MADLISHGLSTSELEMATITLRKHLSAEDSVNMVNLLWSIALSDVELRPNEESHVLHIAEMIGVRGLRAVAEKLNVISEREAAQGKSKSDNSLD